MWKFISISVVLMASALLYSPGLYADHHTADPVAAMAGILINLKHFPSDSDKATLAAIAEGESSDDVKAVAHAIANISHQVGDADKAKLAAIIANDAAPGELKSLAAVVNGLNHFPSADAVSTLESLASR